MSEAGKEVSIVINRSRPLTWQVECVNADGDGGIEVTIFSGPNIEERAIGYARWKYGTVPMPVMSTREPT